MIIPMKKCTLFFSSRYHDEALQQLRKLGVMHIQDVKPVSADDLQHLVTDIDNTDRVLRIFETDTEIEQRSNDEPLNIVNKTLSLISQKESITRELGEYQVMADWFKRWGDISNSSIQALRNAGLFVRLYLTDKNGIAQIPEDKQVFVGGNVNGIVYLALVSQSEDDKLELREELAPKIEPGEVRSKISELENNYKGVSDQLTAMASYRDMLTAYRLKQEKALEFSRVKSGMGDLGDISYLEGYCPHDVTASLKQVADEHKWGYIIDDPDDPGQVPTLIRNSKFANMISPLFKIMNTLPGYEEQDVSFVFLAFFSIFFAIIIGDGGYGLVFLVLSIFMKIKFKKKNSEVVNLMFLLSGTTLVWGLITGTWFGSKTIAGLPFLKPFIIGKLDSFGEESEAFVMLLSFIIGVVHLSVAHLMAAAKKRNMTSFAEFGWVSVLCGIFFLANNLVLSREMPGYAWNLIWVGLGVILLFGNFQKNILMGILLTLPNLILGVIGAFGDIVSYIRLFAVGFAGFIVATSFNSMAIGNGIDSVASGIVAAIIIFAAHALNITLCCMSVLVHGVRLNMLEFSGHVGVQWAGKPYEPFKE
jgi:V/A-type H+/Na+-transporting ATPase subunit I